jgi:predicted metallo-beta-lactamase superfamily hydrolase
MATYVETGSLHLLVDPGASLSPRRFGLAPAPEEEEALGRAIERIEAFAVRATIVTVSHYHADHYRTEPGIYASRRVWAKDPRRMTDPHQAALGRAFWRTMGPLARLTPAEGALLETPDAVVRWSPPLPHGDDASGFGFVVAVTVDDGQRFVHAADVQGPISAVAAAYLLRERPDLLYLSGPPTYLESQVGPEAIARGLSHLLRLVSETGCRVILDHYAVRDRRFRERLAPAFETGRVVTAAEYLGQPEACLEAERPRLWSRHRRAAAGRMAR